MQTDPPGLAGAPLSFVQLASFPGSDDCRDEPDAAVVVDRVRRTRRAAQTRTSAAPHLEQKFAASGFWNPHSGQ